MMLRAAYLLGRFWSVRKIKETAELKYRINGKTNAGGEVEVIAKISPIGKLVIITVYVP